MKNLCFVALIILSSVFSFLSADARKKNVESSTTVTHYVNPRFQDVMLVSHRGYRGYPENTYLALQKSIIDGYKMLECDISFTKDGVAILCHDGSLDRCSDATGLASDYTFAELQKYDFGAWKGEQFKGMKVTTLEDVLKLCRRNNVMLELDCANKKRFPNSAYKQVYELVKKCNMLGSVSFCDSVGNLKTLFDIDPYVIVSFSRIKSKADVDKALENLKHVRAASFSMRYNFATPELVEYIHSKGAKAKIWTINGASSMKKYFDMGVDHILTDKLGPGVENPMR